MGTVVPCAVAECDRSASKRGVCVRHYNRAYARGEHKLLPATHPEADGWVNPLVCVCETPVADPRRDFGMCQTCKRKPLALMAVAS